jgi:hypothetical protein
MDNEAEQPVGAGHPMQAQGSAARQTATVAAIDQQLNDLAQSLQSKVMQFGEADFWSHWFHRYAKYGKELGEKMANIVGVNGIQSQLIDMSDFNTDYPPGVLVYSAKEAEYKSRFANPCVAGARGFIDDVILPSETRKRVCRSLVMLKDKKIENPWRKHGNIPL